MSEINTTSINDLPTDATIGGSVAGNISLVTNEISQPTQHGQQPGGSLSLDQSTISQIVNGLQQASLAGATTLPSRDIPITTQQITNDAQIQPNYIPVPQNRDYINEDEEDINKYYRQENMNDSLDNFYDEIQTPLLLAILYFLFQLPIFKKTIFKYLSFLCNSDGNYNINGLFFISGLFACIYYIITKTVKQFNKF